MRRSVASRIFAAIWALWFATALSEPAALHTCAMHGMAHGAASAPAPSDPAVHPHGASHTHDARGDKAPDPTHASCTCISGCCAAIAAQVPGAPIVIVVSATSLTETIVPRTIVAYRPTTPEYARPPSHAPPFFTA